MTSVKLINEDDIQRSLTRVANNHTEHTNVILKTIRREFVRNRHGFRSSEYVPGVAFFDPNFVDPRVCSDVQHILDWVNSMEEITSRDYSASSMLTLQREAQKTLGKLHKVSFIDAKTKADKWFQMRDRAIEASTKRDPSGQVIIEKTERGNTWLKLTKQEQLLFEGANLKHCIAGYWARVEVGFSEIYSLRDAENKPVLTVEIRHGRLEQEKGMQNRAPTSDEREEVNALLSSIGARRLPNDGWSNLNLEIELQLQDFQEALMGTPRRTSTTDRSPPPGRNTKANDTDVAGLVLFLGMIGILFGFAYLLVSHISA